MLAIAKTTSYITYDPNTCVHHFLNGITDPSLAQAKLSLKANFMQYGGNFDATVKYLMPQVAHQQVNKQLSISSVGNSTACRLKTCDDEGHDLEMPLICYSPKEWAKLSSAQKSSI